MPTSPADTVSAAYQRGILEGRFGTADPSTYRADSFAPLNLRPAEIRSAVNSWTQAQTMHEHTSYYGTFHVRAMRAYWIGRLRAKREEN
jgi:hypothetical protein